MRCVREKAKTEKNYANAVGSEEKRSKRCIMAASAVLPWQKRSVL
jgi:hypothetical protein